MHRLTPGFILGYHGCDRAVGERLLAGEAFKPSNNDYDWLGPGIYFWEANPVRCLEFALEPPRKSVQEAFVVGAVIELGGCLYLTTTAGIKFVAAADENLVALTQSFGANCRRIPGTVCVEISTARLLDTSTGFSKSPASHP